MTTLTPPRPATNSSIPTLTLLAALFVLPFLIGSALFWLDWRPQKFGHHGQLLQPTRTLPETGLRHADGRALPTAELRGKWLLVMHVDHKCDADCRTRLRQLHQVHVALNKEQERVRRVLVIGGAIDPSGAAMLAQVQRDFPDLLVATLAPGAAATSWESALADGAPAIFLVDPLTNVMMRYAEPIEMRGVLKDLERLLRYSWIR